MGKSKVLCVDDQFAIRQLIKEILKEEYDIMTAETGREAINLMDVFDPQVVILDMKLEDMKGTEVLHEIKKIKNDTNIIILTGYEEEDKLKEIEMSKPDLVLHKPFDMNKFKEIIKRLIEENIRAKVAC